MDSSIATKGSRKSVTALSTRKERSMSQCPVYSPRTRNSAVPPQLVSLRARDEATSSAGWSHWITVFRSNGVTVIGIGGVSTTWAIADPAIPTKRSSAAPAARGAHGFFRVVFIDAPDFRLAVARKSHEERRLMPDLLTRLQPNRAIVASALPFIQGERAGTAGRRRLSCRRLPEEILQYRFHRPARVVGREKPERHAHEHHVPPMTGGGDPDRVGTVRGDAPLFPDRRVERNRAGIVPDRQLLALPEAAEVDQQRGAGGVDREVR